MIFTCHFAQPKWLASLTAFIIASYVMDTYGSDTIDNVTKLQTAPAGITYAIR